MGASARARDLVECKRGMGDAGVEPAEELTARSEVQHFEKMALFAGLRVGLAGLCWVGTTTTTEDKQLRTPRHTFAPTLTWALPSACGVQMYSGEVRIGPRAPVCCHPVEPHSGFWIR